VNDGAVLRIAQPFEVIYCCTCRMPFAVPADIRAQWRADDDNWFYCPNGHKQHYDESETVKLRRERDKAAKDAAWYKERLLNERAANERTVRRLNAQRANVTKLKKRISAGVCPCCTRTFSNLSRHMATQHPDYTEQQEAT
jgi:hypothetical protein